ncbi:hypothetical protein ACFLYE_04610 [Chloroflexota bacterium]
MKNRVIRILSLFVLITLFLLPFQVIAADDIEVIISSEGNLECRMTTFEGAGDWQPINPDLGGLIPELNASFNSGLFTMTSGNYANNPSPPTILLWLDGEFGVTFEEPVSSVSFYYCSVVPLTVEGIDENGVVVVSAMGTANDLWTFGVWDPITISVGENIISQVRLQGAPNRVCIDDFKTCRFINQPPEVNSVTASPAHLWPPNHKAVDVAINVDVADPDPDPDGLDDIEGIAYSVADEYGEYNVAETTLPDDGIISLVAERDGKDKDGRIYTITVTVYDASGLSVWNVVTTIEREVVLKTAN